jgi:hypothetical protein
MIVKRRPHGLIDGNPFASFNDRALPDKFDGDNFTV